MQTQTQQGRPTDEPREQFTVRIKPSTRKAIRYAEVEQGRNFSDIAQEALDHWLERQGKA